MTTYYRIKSENNKYIKPTTCAYILVGYEKSLVLVDREAAEILCEALNEEGTYPHLAVEPDTRVDWKTAKAAAKAELLLFKQQHSHIFQKLSELEHAAKAAAKAAGQECSECEDCSETPEQSGWVYIPNSCGCGGEWYCPQCMKEEHPSPSKCSDCIR